MILSIFGDSADRSEGAHPATATRWLATKAETGGKETCPVKSASVFEDSGGLGFRLAFKCYPAAIAFFGRFSEAGARLLRLFIERHCRDRGIRFHLESSRGLLDTFLGQDFRSRRVTPFRD
jgi:hypothetical protein